MAAGAPTPGSADFLQLPLARRQELYNVAKFSAGGQSVPSQLYFTGTEINFIQAASMPTAAWAEQIKTKYPTYAPYLSLPDIGDILKKAVDSGTQPAELAAQVQNTDWWKNHSDTQRQWFLLNATDPHSATQALQTQLAEVQKAASQYGVHVSPSILTGLAINSLASGWNQDKVLQELIRIQGNEPGGMTGVLGATKDDLRKLSTDYMIPMGDHALTAWTRNVVTGKQTTAGFEDYLRNLAKSQFADPQIHKALDAGHTMKEFADPYVQMASTTLGLNPLDVSMGEPKWIRALQYRDDPKNPPRAMTLDEWGRTLRTDNAYGYDYTDKGRSEASQLVGSLAQEFGRIG